MSIVRRLSNLDHRLVLDRSVAPRSSPRLVYLRTLWLSVLLAVNALTLKSAPRELWLGGAVLLLVGLLTVSVWSLTRRKTNRAPEQA